MDNVFARLLMESTALQVDEWAIFSYLAANALTSDNSVEKDYRFRGKIFSSVDYDEICTRFNLLDTTVKRILKKFESIGWLKLDSTGTVLGEWTADKKKFWYCSKNLDSCKQREPRKETATQQLRRLVAEQRKNKVAVKMDKLPFIERSKILADIKSSKTSTPGVRILNTVKSCYIAKFNKAYQLAKDNKTGAQSYPKEIGFWNRALGYTGNDEEKLIEVIQWTFDNWDTVRTSLGFLGTPNCSLFATKVYFTHILKLKGELYAQTLNVGQRFNEREAKSAPSMGFE